MKTETPLTKEYFDAKFSYFDKKFGSIDAKFKSIDKRFDRIETTFVTKKYLDEKLSAFVTKDFFTKEIRNLRGSLHESLVTTLDNMKEYYQDETERYIGALNEDADEKRKATEEKAKILDEKWNNHESRILKLEDVLV